MQFKRNLAEVFESLSGSITFKEQYDALVTKRHQCEEQIRVLSEQLKDKRHEKIKLRGLSDYQKQIEICIQEQKDTEMVLQVVQILIKDMEIKQAQSKLAEITESASQNTEKRKVNLTEIKKSEAELRKLENDINDSTAKARTIRAKLEENQGAAQQSEKQLETCKRMIEQKSGLLAQY